MRRFFDYLFPPQFYTVDIYDAETSQKPLLTIHDVSKQDTTLNEIRQKIDEKFHQELRQDEDVGAYHFIIGKMKILEHNEISMKLKQIWQRQEDPTMSTSKNKRKRCSIRFIKITRSPSGTPIVGSAAANNASADAISSVNVSGKNLTKKMGPENIFFALMYYTFMSVLAIGPFFLPLKFDIFLSCVVGIIGLFGWIIWGAANMKTFNQNTRPVNSLLDRIMNFFDFFSTLGQFVAFLKSLVFKIGLNIPTFLISAHFMGYLVDDDFIFGDDDGETYRLVLVGILTPVLVVVLFSILSVVFDSITWISKKKA